MPHSRSNSDRIRPPNRSGNPRGVLAARHALYSWGFIQQERCARQAFAGNANALRDPHAYDYRKSDAHGHRLDHVGPLASARHPIVTPVRGAEVSCPRPDARWGR